MGFILFITGCTDSENSLHTPTDQNFKTRGDLGTTTALNRDEAISIADHVLNRVGSGLNKSVQVIVDTKSVYSGKLLPDTLAYVVNYGNENGYAIVANNRNLTSPIAYSLTGTYTEEPSILKYLVLDIIPQFMSDLNNNKLDDELNEDVIPGGGRGSNLDVPIHTSSPFCDKIYEEFKCSNAGMGVVSTAMLLSFFNDQFIFNHYKYGFKKMIYALKQGPGYSPIIAPTSDIPVYPGIEVPLPDLTISFTDSYDGAVAAYNQLLYDIAKATDTRYYTNGHAVTSPEKVKEFLRNQGFEVSEEVPDYPCNNMMYYLNNNYILNFWFNVTHKDGYPIGDPLYLGPVSVLIDYYEANLGFNGWLVDGYFRIKSGDKKNPELFINHVTWKHDYNVNVEFLTRFAVKKL